MKILYDHQIFTAQKYGGISRYFAQIISNLPENTQINIAIKYSNNEYLNNYHLVPKIEKLVYPIEKFLPGIEFRGKYRFFCLLNRFNPFKSIDPYIFNKNLSIELLKKQDFDIFHPTYYDDYFLDYIGNKPFVLTIHDMIHELYPEMLNNIDLSRKKALLAKAACHIIAVSENTKKDIIDILGIDERKISVVHHANSLQFSDAECTNLPNEYLLFVGDRGNYKNFLFFVRAVEPILKNRPTLKIICTGRDFSKHEIDTILDLGLEHHFLTKNVSDKELIMLYNYAKMLVFPSYYEGFGIPILEAFNAGCPVVLSDASCFREIAEDCALYFNPKDINDMRSVINIVMNDDLRKERLIEKSKLRAKDFSWSLSAKKTYQIYEKVLQSTLI